MRSAQAAGRGEGVGTALHGGQPLLGNAGSVNAYFRGPLRGPDGWWHVSFLWRDTPDAATCPDISYNRTRGSSLDTWETVQGNALTLPVVSTDSAAVADPVAARARLINSVNALGFDSKGRAVVSYHKYDAQGVSLCRAGHEEVFCLGLLFARLTGPTRIGSSSSPDPEQV